MLPCVREAVRVVVRQEDQYAPVLEDRGRELAGRDRPGAVERWSAADLQQRLRALPDGHPSSPYDADGSAKPPPVDLRELELPLPDEERPTGTDWNGGESNDRGDKEVWRQEVPRLQELWEEHQERWPRPEREPGAEADDEPGSWRGDSGRTLTAAQNDQVDLGCEGITVREERITDRLRQIEDTSVGDLVGLDFRLKGNDRIKDKVAAAARGAPNADVDRILTNIPDAVRYTFQYDKESYSEAVISEVSRMKEDGFYPVKLRNYWDDEEYKGINSQWRDGQTGQHFEVQFHTAISFEAKQLTHGAYERLRRGDTTPAEASELRAFQREVSSRIPIPPGAREIPDYP